MKCGKYYVFFRNLSNPVRIKIIGALSQGDCSVGELCEKTRVEQSKLSHALACLKSCNIVNCKQDGKQRIYSLNKKTIVPILKIIDKHRCKFCGKNEN